MSTHINTHTHTLEYYSSIKKNEIVSFAASWMDLKIIIISKISQKEKDKYHMISPVCRNATQMNLSMKQKQIHRHTEETSVAKCACIGTGWEFANSRCKLLYIGRINNKVLLYSTGNYILYPVINTIKKRMYTYV